MELMKIIIILGYITTLRHIRFPAFVSLCKTLYQTCFSRGQGCKWWSYRPKVTSSVLSDVKPINYIL